MPKMSTAQQTIRRRYFCTTKGRAYQLRRNAKQRAERKGLTFDLSQEFILNKLENGFCEVTGLPFTMRGDEDYGTRSTAQPFSPSLDREFPEFGYTEENTRVVVSIYNYAKMHWTHDHVMIMARALTNIYGEEN